MEENYMGTFSERVKALMLEKKLSQKDLSKLSNITEPSLCRYLNSQVTPRADIVINIAKVFNVSENYLLGKSEKTSFEKAYEETLKVVARNRKVLTKEEKAEIISILYGESDYEDPNV